MRHKVIKTLLFSLGLISAGLCYAEDASIKLPSYISTSKTLKVMTPDKALKKLMDGNKRFMNNKSTNRNLLKQAKVTSKKGQFPASVILSCMDSRGTPELIFDQGLGDIFTVRLAGNVVDKDQLGGMEFATKLVGTKLIVVLGHTQCGAVAGACAGAELGNLTQLLDKIQPAVTTYKKNNGGKADCNDYSVVDQIARQNVVDMIKEVTKDSPVIAKLVKDGQVKIVGAMHDLRTGKVVFFDAEGKDIS